MDVMNEVDCGDGNEDEDDGNDRINSGDSDYKDRPQ